MSEQTAGSLLLVQQKLLSEWKPLVDWARAYLPSVVFDSETSTLTIRFKHADGQAEWVMSAKLVRYLLDGRIQHFTTLCWNDLCNTKSIIQISSHLGSSSMFSVASCFDETKAILMVHGKRHVYQNQYRAEVEKQLLAAAKAWSLHTGKD